MIPQNGIMSDSMTMLSVYVCVCVREREREREREMGCYMAKGMELSKDNMAEYFNFENLKRGLPH